MNIKTKLLNNFLPKSEFDRIKETSHDKKQDNLKITLSINRGLKLLTISWQNTKYITNVKYLKSSHFF